MFKSLVISFLALVFSSNTFALSISNMNDKERGDAIIRLSIPPADLTNESGSCWNGKNDGNLEGKFSMYVYLPYGETMKTGLAASTLCILAVYPSDSWAPQQFATNPLSNSEDCKIEFVKIHGGGDGTARATSSCNYKGNPA